MPQPMWARVIRAIGIGVFVVVAAVAICLLVEMDVCSVVPSSFLFLIALNIRRGTAITLLFCSAT